MKEKWDTKASNGVNPIGSYPSKAAFKIKRLIFYLFYVGVVLAIGAKLGAFRGRSAPSSSVSLAARPASASTPLGASEQPVLLPRGILAFDGELKQATVHEGDTQAHFVFNLTNVSRKPVIIDSVATSCGCTVAQLPQMPWTLAPHAKGQIPVTMNILGYTGKTSKTVTIITVQGSKVLSVEVNILSPEVGTMGDREHNLELAKVNRQAVFKGDCAKCHADPAKGKTGQELYMVACAICHEAKPRASMVPDLQILNHPTDSNYWKMIIALGKPGTLMPAFADEMGGPLNGDQIVSLAEFLTQKFPTGQAAIPPVKPDTQGH